MTETPIPVAPMTNRAVAELSPSSEERLRCKAALRLLEQVAGFLLFTQLLVISGVVLAGVVSRYGFNSSFSWTEELASWLLISLTFTGMAVGHISNRHISINLIGNLPLPRPILLARPFVVDVILALTTFMLLAGAVGMIGSMSGVSVTLHLDARIKYVTIPLACLLSIAILWLSRMRDQRSWSLSLLPIEIGGTICAIGTLWVAPLSDVNPAIVMWATFAICLAIGVPIGFSMLFGGVLCAWATDVLPIAGVVNNMVEGASAFVFLAIPFFLTAGYLMNSGGLSVRLIDFASALVGHFRGGLAQANVFHSVMLGGVCGSSNADAASTTKILVPQMIKRGYSPAFACAATAVGSILPACFPPSIALLIYASVSGVSVAQLFTAGIVPGLLLCLVMMAMIHFIASRRNYEKAPERAPFREMVRTGLRASPAMFVAVVIVGLLRAGVMTATEVGTIAVIWAFVFGKFIYRGFTMRQFYTDMVECALDTALVCFLVAVAYPFAWVMLAEQLPTKFIAWLVPLVHHQWQMFLVVNAIAFVSGCVLEVAPSILILAPLLTPLLLQMGIDPIHGGIIVMLNLILATVAPPMGILVFTSSSIARVPTGPVFAECIPFIVGCYSVLLLVTFVPSVALTLWKFIGY